MAEPFKPRYWIGAPGDPHDNDGYHWQLDADGIISLYLDGELFEDGASGRSLREMETSSRFLEVPESPRQV